MSRALQAALQRLLAVPDGRLPASQLSAAQRKALDQFRQRTGALALQRSGRGVVCQLLDREVAVQRLRELSPLADSQATASAAAPEPAATSGADVAAVPDLTPVLPARAANIGRRRSSKAGRHAHDRTYLLLRGRGAVCWQDAAGHRLDLQQATAGPGAGALAITPSVARPPHAPDSMPGGMTGTQSLAGVAAGTDREGARADPGWHSTAPLWLVENQALFDRLDWLPGSEPVSVVWYSGQLRNLLIDWLAAQPRTPQLWLFPDYDGVGLHNYLRLRQRLGNQVRLWLMPDWQARLRAYGSNALWQSTFADFELARAGLAPWLDSEPELAQLLTAMQQQGLALEQEAVWL